MTKATDHWPLLRYYRQWQKTAVHWYVLLHYSQWQRQQITDICYHIIDSDRRKQFIELATALFLVTKAKDLWPLLLYFSHMGYCIILRQWQRQQSTDLCYCIIDKDRGQQITDICYCIILRQWQRQPGTDPCYRFIDKDRRQQITDMCYCIILSDKGNRSLTSVTVL